MFSKTEISNVALSHLAIGKAIGDFDLDQTPEAKACRQMYDLALQTLLRQYPWKFANKTAELSLEDTDPTPEYSYQYAYPSDCLYAERIPTGSGAQDTLDTRIPAKIVRGPSGRSIYSNEAEASLEYRSLVDDPLYFPPDFVLALSYRLAALIASRVTDGTREGLKDIVQGMYGYSVQVAATANANEGAPQLPPESELARSR